MKSPQRNKQERQILQHMTDESSIDEAGVTLLHELVFALTWSKETHDKAVEQMQSVIKLNSEQTQLRTLYEKG